MSSLAELGALKKAAIIVPMPESHQEANAHLVQQARAAQVTGRERVSRPGPVIPPGRFLRPVIPPGRFLRPG